MTKVSVNQDKCIGCGACVAIAPDIFDFNEEGLSTVINDELTVEAKEASEACPVFAIDIEGECCSECDCDCGCDCDCDCGCDCDCDCGCDCK